MSYGCHSEEQSDEESLILQKIGEERSVALMTPASECQRTQVRTKDGRRMSTKGPHSEFLRIELQQIADASIGLVSCSASLAVVPGTRRSCVCWGGLQVGMSDFLLPSPTAYARRP